MTEPLAAAPDLNQSGVPLSGDNPNVRYALAGSYSTVQVVSPTLIHDVVYCTIRTQPSGVVASIPVRDTVFDQGAAGSELTNFAQAIETVMNNPHVVAGVGSQSIDDSGLLADSVVFTVQYIDPVHAPNGATAQATVEVSQLNVGDPANCSDPLAGVSAIIDDVYANLKAAAGG